jgi:hypothetical protein
VTSRVPSGPPSTFSHAHGVGIDEGSAAVYIATNRRLSTVPGPIGFSLYSLALRCPIAVVRHDNIKFARNGERMHPSGHPDPTVFSDTVLLAADQRAIIASSGFGVASRVLVTN